MQKIDFDEAVRVFVTYCKAKGLAGRTVETYTSSLERLWELLASTDGDPGISSPDQLRRYIVHLLEAGLARRNVCWHPHGFHPLLLQLPCPRGPRCVKPHEECGNA